MDHIVEVLNYKPRGALSLYGEPLIRLMERLNGCGGNLKKMMDGDPELEQIVREVCVTRWIPSTNRTANLVLQPFWEHIMKRELTPGQVDQMRPERFAALLFYVGTLNPEWDKLAGPCKWKRCGKYFLLKRKRRTAYCSRRCCQRNAASRCTKKRLQREHADKLRVAAELAQKWATGRTKDGWKQWVSNQPAGVRAEITPKFLTRAVNKGELKTPTKGR